MFHPVPLFVGLRYVRSRSHAFFVSFITWVSLAGVAVGVAALIVILSVMNGFEGELRDRLLSLTAHARIVPASPGQAPVPEGVWQSTQRAAAAVPGVLGVAPYLEVQALAVRSAEMLPIVLRGIDPRAESTVTAVADSIAQGRLASIVPGSNAVIVGQGVAARLGLLVGDPITLLIPTTDANGTPTPRLQEFTVAGVFEVGVQDHDGTLVFADRADVAAALGKTGTAGGLRLRFDDALAAPERAAAVAKVLPRELRIIDWTRDNASYFRAIRIEKTMMALILLLIVGVAAFNIVSMLVMVVTDKRTDIAILRTLGASQGEVRTTFLIQGLVIGWIGVVFGIGLGVALALNVDRIVPFLERTFGFQIMDSDVYYITSIPSEVHLSNVLAIGVAALLLTGLATVYPALRAARTAPAEALRYE